MKFEEIEDPKNECAPANTPRIGDMPCDD